MALEVELVSPEAILFTGEATFVQARTLGGGDILFLEGHAPFIGALATWPILIRLTDGTDQHVAVHGGFVEVSHNAVKVLSDTAELESQIDVERAKRARQRAEDALRQNEDAEAEAALARAECRLRTVGALDATH